MSAFAAAPEIGEFRQVRGCDKDRSAYSTPASIVATRQGGVTVLTIEAVLNCGVAAKHSVVSGKGTLSITLHSVLAPGGAITACMCLRTFELKLPQPLEPGTVVTLVNGGAQVRVD